MATTPLTAEPSSIYAGDSINWLITLADYPASGGWTLKYNLVATPGSFAITSTASGADHAVAVIKTTTATYLPGTYSVAKYVDHADGTRVTIGELILIVRPNLASKTGSYDNRTHAKKVLDAIEAVLEGRASSDQLEYTIDGESLKRTPVADLLMLRSRYLQYWQQEQSAANISAGLPGKSRRILVRF